MNLLRKFSFPTRFSNTLIAFSRDKRATIAVIGAMVALPMILLIGALTDVGRGYLVRSELSQAVDAATLAAAKAVGTEHESTEFMRFISANFDSASTSAEISEMSVNYDEEANQVVVDVVAKMQTSFLQVLHLDEIPIRVHSVVQRDRSELELALVLDVTGSMSGSKLTALKTAANELVDIVFVGNSQDERVNISVVPFSARVNIGNEYRDWLNYNPANSWSGCTEVRDGDAGLSDILPSAAGFDPSETMTRTGWVRVRGRWVIQDYEANIPCPTKMSSLKHNAQSIKNEINQLQAGGTTRTDIGLLWGWRSVSADWHGLWHGSPGLPSEDPETLKAIILMTDGQNVPSYSNLSTWDADQRLRQICESVKDEDIQLFTITFQAPSSINDMYRECATTGGHFFQSPDRASLENAFNEIAGQLSQLRLAQ